MDHPADVIIHGWGVCRRSAFEQAITGMFNYMTPLTGVREDASGGIEVDVTGAHDVNDLLYRLMDEFLFRFATELFVCKRVEIDAMGPRGEDGQLCAHARGFGERFDLSRHEQGTEIKAITMHNMHINETPQRCDVYVLVDI